MYVKEDLCHQSSSSPMQNIPAKCYILIPSHTVCIYDWKVNSKRMATLSNVVGRNATVISKIVTKLAKKTAKLKNKVFYTTADFHRQKSVKYIHVFGHLIC